MNKKYILNWWKLKGKDMITLIIVMLVGGYFLKYLGHLQKGAFKDTQGLIFIPYIITILFTALLFLKIRIKNLEQPLTWYPWIPRIAYHIFILIEYTVAIAISFLGIKKPWLVAITLPIVWSLGRSILSAIVKGLNNVHIFFNREAKDNN